MTNLPATAVGAEDVRSSSSPLAASQSARPAPAKGIWMSTAINRGSLHPRMAARRAATVEARMARPTATPTSRVKYSNPYASEAGAGISEVPFGSSGSTRKMSTAWAKAQVGSIRRSVWRRLGFMRRAGKVTAAAAV